MRRSEYLAMYRVEDDHWWYRTLHELVLGYVPANRSLRVLDAGCGTGRLLELLRPHGRAEGCDASLLALHFCRKRGVDAARLDLNTDCLEPCGYDLITSIDVLYHRAVRDDVSVLRKLHAALKPEGRLILQVPAYEWLRSNHDEAVHTGRRYTRKEVEAMVKACGFVVEKSTYRVALLFVPIAAVRLLQKLTTHPDRASAPCPSDVKRHSPW